MTLAIQADGASAMQLSNASDFSGASWEGYTSRRTGWGFDTTAQGSKTVYLWVKDLAGNVGSTPATWAITLMATIWLEPLFWAL